MRKFSDLGIKAEESKAFIGDKIKIDKILNRQITILDYKIAKSKYDGDCLCLQIILSDTKRIVFTGSKKLTDIFLKTEKEQFPFMATIIREDDDSFNLTD